MTALVPRIFNRSRWGWLDDEFDHVFEGFFRPMRLFEERTTHDLVPAIDVREDENQYVVRAELPGIKKDDIAVTLENGILTISAGTKSEHEQKDGERVIRRERRYGKYMRSLRLGTEIDENKAKANYKDGVLELVLPKSEAVKPKRIAVDVH